MTVTVPEYGGCPWPIDPACLGTTWDAYEPAVQDRAVALASSTLSRLTGYRVGGCPITVRPCAPRCAGGLRPYDIALGASLSAPMNWNGNWVNGCGCSGSCGHTSQCEVRLPPPVGRIDEVKANGVVVAPADYRVDGDLLVWQGSGECPWSLQQDLSRPDTEPGTFSVTYLNSYAPDSNGAYAAGILAAEYAKACTGGKCRLPAGVTTLVRDGISLEIASGAFPNGMTGIREVDSYIALWNPGGMRQAPMIYSPSVGLTRVQGG